MAQELTNKQKQDGHQGSAFLQQFTQEKVGAWFLIAGLLGFAAILFLAMVSHGLGETAGKQQLCSDGGRLFERAALY